MELGAYCAEGCGGEEEVVELRNIRQKGVFWGVCLLLDRLLEDWIMSLFFLLVLALPRLLDGTVLVVSCVVVHLFSREPIG